MYFLQVQRLLIHMLKKLDILLSSTQTFQSIELFQKCKYMNMRYKKQQKVHEFHCILTKLYKSYHFCQKLASFTLVREVPSKTDVKNNNVLFYVLKHFELCGSSCINLPNRTGLRAVVLFSLCPSKPPLDMDINIYFKLQNYQKL